MTKYIVVVGGVISGVGKGVSTASLGKILQEYGYSVTAVKIDPYLNFDAGTMRPTEHGEVWVTADGGEIDQDLGNYERFLGKQIPRTHNITTGQVYNSVIEKERKGEYLGKTVQIFPHISNEVKHRIKTAAEGHDICLIEIGGTIGDYENVPFLFASKGLEREFGKDNVLYIMVTYLLVPRHMAEMKTKPTQQAIRMLGESAGIFPDYIFCRGPAPLDDIRREKIEVYANIPSGNIISEPDIDTIYRIPLDLEKEDMGEKILKSLKLEPRKEPNWKNWQKLVNAIVTPKEKIKIAMISKYIAVGDFTLEDSYVSVNQALIHAGANLDATVQIDWIDAASLEENPAAVMQLKEYQGILVPGGFGNSGVEGKIKAIKYARENDIPFLGLCYGLQLALIEYARNLCGLEGAHTAEVDENAPHRVIDILPTQKELLEKGDYGNTMRLGSYAAALDPLSKVYALYNECRRLQADAKEFLALTESRVGTTASEHVAVERHRHRYEVSPIYIDQLKTAGLQFPGFHTREDGTKLVEFIELPNHPFFMATQAHPEFKSRLDDPAPLFYGFVRACIKKL